MEKNEDDFAEKLKKEPEFAPITLREQSIQIFTKITQTHTNTWINTFKSNVSRV